MDSTVDCGRLNVTNMCSAIELRDSVTHGRYGTKQPNSIPKRPKFQS